MSSYQPTCQLTQSILQLGASTCEQLRRWSVMDSALLSSHSRCDNRISALHAPMAIEHLPISLQQMTAVLDGERVFGQLEERSEKILALLYSEPRLLVRMLAERLGISPRAVEKQIAKLREQGHLRRIGPAKGGHWEVMQ